MEKAFTAEKYVTWLKTQAMLKRPYWYGTCGYECTDSLLKSKAKQYPKHYGATRIARYRRDISAGQVCADCVGGAIKWAVWSGLGTHRNVYQSGGCPDTSADGMFAFCRQKGMDWGAIGTLPERPGVALRRSGHVGVYIGDGRAVEWRGFDYGCVVTQVAQRGWTHWYELPWVDYGAAAGATDAPATALLGARLLRQGCKGGDVRQLQEALLELGYDLPKYGADGQYGQETESAVRQLQAAAGIEVDGKYGDESHAALMALLAEAADDEESAAAAVGRIRITGGTVNIRAGASTQHRILTVARIGTELEYTALADNGWYAVQLPDGTGWVSGKYAEVVA